MAVVSGGTTLIDNGALDAGVPTGSLILLSTQTASASASISFTSGIDSTYDSYVFKFYDIHPETDGGVADFSFNLSIDGGSNYNVTKTTTSFYAGQFESGTGFADIYYEGSYDLAQSTAFQFLGADLGADDDQSSAGTLHLYNPSSTTFVKHFMSDYNRYIAADGGFRDFVAGYGNTTSAVNAVQFKMAGGNFSGVIKLYGIK
jgi:hypothetical protein